MRRLLHDRQTAGVHRSILCAQNEPRPTCPHKTQTILQKYTHRTQTSRTSRTCARWTKLAPATSSSSTHWQQAAADPFSISKSVFGVWAINCIPPSLIQRADSPDGAYIVAVLNHDHPRHHRLLSVVHHRRHIPSDDAPANRRSTCGSPGAQHALNDIIPHSRREE